MDEGHAVFVKDQPVTGGLPLGSLLSGFWYILILSQSPFHLPHLPLGPGPPL